MYSTWAQLHSAAPPIILAVLSSLLDYGSLGNLEHWLWFSPLNVGDMGERGKESPFLLAEEVDR